MSKLLLLLLFGVVAYLLFKGVRRRATARREGDRPAPGAERMVACAQCGVHLPEGEAIAGEGRHFCCEEHRRIAR